jgi:ABC-type branched-subunit amino acid transport system ATPase component
MRICTRGYLLSNGAAVLSGTVAELESSQQMHDLYLGGLDKVV